ncbi:MAG: hypothetical protein LBQ19_03875 [Synergistaceae bacterium]|nr:hypothetical protein [Synergistaceae bacterium]
MEIRSQSRGSCRGEPADSASLFWMAKKSQIIAMSSISDTKKIETSADRIIRSAEAIQAKVDALRTKIAERGNNPAATPEELLAAAATSRYLDQLEICCNQVRSKAGNMSSEMENYSNNINSFMLRMDSCLSDLREDGRGPRGQR